VSLSTGEYEINKNLVSMYPNPVESSVTIANAAKATINIYNTNGSIVFTQYISSENESVDLGTLTMGIYYAKVLSPTGVSMVKLVKE